MRKKILASSEDGDARSVVLFEIAPFSIFSERHVEGSRRSNLEVITTFPASYVVEYETKAVFHSFSREEATREYENRIGLYQVGT